MGEPAVVVYVVKKWGNRWEMKWGDGVAGHYGSEWRGKAEDGENPGGGGGCSWGREEKNGKGAKWEEMRERGSRPLWSFGGRAKKRGGIYVTIHQGAKFCLFETLLFTFQIQWILWKINHLSYTVILILRALPIIPSCTLT